jgi:hypothetical protein
MVVHRIPRDWAAPADVGAPPVRRATAPFKPVFFVPSLVGARVAVEAHGGVMNSPDKEWSFNGARVCDGLDPEGNVIQFRESA